MSEPKILKEWESPPAKGAEFVSQRQRRFRAVLRDDFGVPYLIVEECHEDAADGECWLSVERKRDWRHALASLILSECDYNVEPITR